jgi:hypothetical protein
VDTSAWTALDYRLVTWRAEIREVTEVRQEKEMSHPQLC